MLGSAIYYAYRFFIFEPINNSSRPRAINAPESGQDSSAFASPGFVDVRSAIDGDTPCNHESTVYGFQALSVRNLRPW